MGMLERFTIKGCYGLHDNPLQACSGTYKFNTPLFPPPCCEICALLPLNKLCQINASLSKSSISFSVQFFVGRDCRNIMISWKSMRCSFSDHLTRKAAQT